MDQPVKKANLLILRGVQPGDFTQMDEIFDKIGKPKHINPEIEYTKLPDQFVGVEFWPKSSNLKCWDCDQIPKSYPAFIPANPRKDSEGNDICDAKGHYSSWNCAVSDAIKTYPRDQLPDILDLITLFESKFSGKRKKKIMPCPRKIEMKSYCGASGITPEEWEEKRQALDRNYDLSSYRLEHYRTNE